MEEATIPQNSTIAKKIKPKKSTPGVVYLHYIPRFMTVKLIREYFSRFGEVKRMSIVPEKKKNGKQSKFFTEGWIEFAKKKYAKQVALCLNNTQVGGRRRSPFYDSLWSIKYLPKFQWSQLNEKQHYLKAQKGQRMRAEIAQAKREIDFYTRGAEKVKRRKKKNKGNDQVEADTVSIHNTDETNPFGIPVSPNDERKGLKFLDGII